MNYVKKIYTKSNFIPVPRIVYTAVVLDQESKEKLKRIFPGKHSVKYGEHVTLKFRPSEFPDNLGKKVNMTVYSYAISEYSEAVGVKLFGIDSDNIIPHITISTKSNVKPVYSNELMNSGSNAIEPFNLTGNIASFINGHFIYKLD